MGVHCRSSTAVQRIGDLFSTTNDFFLWMVILHKREFIGRMRDLQSSISAVPSSAEAYEICQRTNRVLKAHDYGIKFLTIGRARLLWDEDKFLIDWKYVRLTSLSVEDMSGWGDAGGNVASNIVGFVESMANLEL